MPFSIQLLRGTSGRTNHSARIRGRAALADSLQAAFFTGVHFAIAYTDVLPKITNLTFSAALTFPE